MAVALGYILFTETPQGTAEYDYSQCDLCELLGTQGQIGDETL